MTGTDRDQADAFMRSIVPPEEERRAYTSAPPSGFRWFKSGNVLDLEKERRRRSSRPNNVLERPAANCPGGACWRRAVLADRRSVEQAARLHSAESARDISSVSWLFRRCLNLLANKLGFASAPRPSRQRLGKDQPVEPADDPALKANAAELVDPTLRQGRPGV
jgi:hypothetical protein